jgi:hypothetical protein
MGLLTKQINTYYNDGDYIIHNHWNVHWLESTTTNICKVYSRKVFKLS